MASFEAGPCGVPPFCTLHRFAPGPATPRTDDANQADHADEARRHAPSIANLRSQRRPLRPKHPFFGASGRGGLHVEHNTEPPTTQPRRATGGFATIEPPVTACRRRVAPLWSQFPPDNKTKRGNSARAAYHPTHQRQRSRLRPAQRAPQRPDYGDHEPHTLARPPDMTRMHGVQDTCLGNIYCLFFTLLITTFNTDFSAPLGRKVPGLYTRFTF